MIHFLLSTINKTNSIEIPQQIINEATPFFYKVIIIMGVILLLGVFLEIFIILTKPVRKQIGNYENQGINFVWNQIKETYWKIYIDYLNKQNKKRNNE